MSKYMCPHCAEAYMYCACPTNPLNEKRSPTNPAKPEKTRSRDYWDIGEDPPFRPSKDRCQKLILALVLCDGKITDTFSLDTTRSYMIPKCGEIRYNMKPASIAVLIRISLPVGLRNDFERLMGYQCLTTPPVITGN